MKQVTLHNNFSLSQIVYGVWRWHEHQSTDDVQKILETCLAAGIDSFDHADIYNDYSNEQYFGKLLQLQPSLRKQAS